MYTYVVAVRAKSPPQELLTLSRMSPRGRPVPHSGCRKVTHWRAWSRYRSARWSN